MTDLKENSSGQKMYEQLQEILNKCIELGWNYCYLNEYLECNKEGLLNEDLIPLISYHDLFSKDSGIMEFVGWKQCDYKYEAINSFAGTTILQNHYFVMSDMTAEEKCNYFVNNAIIPTK